jgi:transcriptional regulator with XRE-family HTH domain
MDLRAYRKSRGLSQLACAKELGLNSKGYVSEIETGSQPPSTHLALKIQKWSNGQVPARSLLPPEKAALLPDASAPAGP